MNARVIKGWSACGVMAMASVASAASVTVDNFTSIGSEPFKAKVTIEDVVGGDVKFTVEVVVDNPLTDNLADLRALFIDINDESLLSGLSVTGSDVTDFDFDANSVDNLGGGAVISPAGPYDIGVEIGTSGITPDDIQMTMFVFSHSTMDLSIDNFLGQSMGIRGMSTGLEGGSRSGSSKLTNEVPDTPDIIVVPVPGAAWMGLGLLGAMTGVKTLRRRRA